MNPEPAFLISAVRRFLNPEAPLPDFTDIDWPKLLRLADAHAVTPMLFTALADVQIPETVAGELRSGLESSVQRSFMQTAELVRLVGLLETEKIQVVALKGPTLSRYLYGDVGSRASGDIDVLAKREDVLRVRDLLVANGYTAVNTLHWNSYSACLRLRGREMAFESPLSVSIDVHWSLLPPDFASAFDQLDAWGSLRTELLTGQQIHTLAPEPMLLFLCAHGSKHMFERLAWICDIARFLMVTPDLDWTAIVEHSRRTRTLRQLLLSVRLSADLLHVQPPVDLPKDPAVEPLVRDVRDRLLAGATPPATRSESARFCLRLLEPSSHKLRFLYRQYITPSEAEFRVLKLPPPLYFLYYPFRPLRLLWRHTVGRSG